MRPRPGFALLVTLLMTLALAAIGVGMLTVAAKEAEVAAALVRGARSRAAAETAVRAAVAAWSTRSVAHLGPGETAALATVAGSGLGVAAVQVTRVDGDLFLVEAVAHGSARAAVAVRTLDPGLLTADFRAAVQADSGALLRGGMVSGFDVCGQAEAVAGVVSPQLTVDIAAAALGEPPAEAVEPAPMASAHLLAPPLRDALADVFMNGGTVSPRPEASSGQCLPDPLNWGSVSGTSPCHDLLPMVAVPGNLAVQGGEGRGLVVADGDLHLDGFTFQGVLVVGGHLSVGPGTSIRGAVRARHVEVLDGSIAYDSCAILAAASAGGLDRAFRPGHRWWLPAF
jgi:hypothetical protein